MNTTNKNDWFIQPAIGQTKKVQDKICPYLSKHLNK